MSKFSLPMDIRRRYETDARFKQLADSMEHMVNRNDLTFKELDDALLVAKELHRERYDWPTGTEVVCVMAGMSNGHEYKYGDRGVVTGQDCGPIITLEGNRNLGHAYLKNFRRGRTLSSVPNEPDADRCIRCGETTACRCVAYSTEPNYRDDDGPKPDSCDGRLYGWSLASDPNSIEPGGRDSDTDEPPND